MKDPKVTLNQDGSAVLLLEKGILKILDTIDVKWVQSFVWNHKWYKSHTFI